MKLLSLSLFLAALFAIPLQGQERPAPTEVDGKIDWVFELEEAQQLSKDQNKPIFMVFRCER